MYSLALELIYIHRIHHSDMMDIVMGREEVCNGNLRLMRISIFHERRLECGDRSIMS